MFLNEYIHSIQNKWETKKLSPCSVQCSSVAQLCLTLCDPLNRSTPGLPVHHRLPEFTQTPFHQVADAIQPSHPLSSPSPPAPNPSQHQSLFQWVSSSHEVVKVLAKWYSPAHAGNASSIPGSGRFPGGGNGNPLQYSFPKNPMDIGPWWAAVHGVAISQTWLGDWAWTHAKLDNE